MTVTLLVLILVMGAFVGWLIRQTVNVEPWVAESQGEPPSQALPDFATAPRVGLAVFLAVVTAVFALAISAYMMRMELGSDWRAVPEPGLLWGNTTLLVLGSVALQWALHAARRAAWSAFKVAVLAGSVLTVAFIVGQYLVWQQLNQGGYYLTSNPANAFFYFLTALHVVHMLGGLVALGRTARKILRGAEASELRASIELCTAYWHFLLFIWIVIFWLVLST